MSRTPPRSRVSSIIPNRELAYYEWTGTGWIDIDPVTCAAGYIISGGKSGGETVQEWDITYPDLHCIEPIGPITVTPSATGDLYCAESNAKWTFTVPTIKYWGKDDEGNCELLKTEGKDFPVKYTIKYIADKWGPGEYIFKCGSYTTDCGCTMIDKTVTIVKVDFPSGDFATFTDKDRTMSVTVTPASASASVTFQSANTAIATVAGTAPSLTIHGSAPGYTAVQALLNAVECSNKDITVTEVKSLTYATIPADRTRTTIGIGELVMIFTDPPTLVNWSLTGGGMIDASYGTGTVLWAELSPSQPKVTATVADTKCELSFDVIAPTGLQYHPDNADAGGFPGTPGPPNNFIGNGRRFPETILPTTVSFYRVDFRENKPGNTINWPDGTVETGVSAGQPQFTVNQANGGIADQIVSGLRPYTRLYDGSNFVAFTYTIDVPFEYQHDNGSWSHAFISAAHNKIFTAEGGCALNPVASNSQQSAFRGPWQ